jgi:hypothetical protein
MDIKKPLVFLKRILSEETLNKLLYVIRVFAHFASSVPVAKNDQIYPIRGVTVIHNRHDWLRQRSLRPSE